MIMGYSRVMRTKLAMGVGVVLVMGLSLFSTGCYLLSQSGTYLSDRMQAKPLEKLEKDPSLDEITKDFLAEVRDINSFAIDEIGLIESKNYTSYVELDRAHLAYIVYASDELRLKQYLWKFPLVGALPYKGYFSLASARKEEQKMKDRGYDTWVGIVDGFSSLGMFRDPLYSFMKEYSPYRLSNLIIHELTHATIWVKGYTTFNEQLAAFIGDKGAKQYISSKFSEDSEEYTEIFQKEYDRDLFLQKIDSLRISLTELYDDSFITDFEKRSKKEHILEEFSKQFALTYEEEFKTDTYRHISELPINNAFIGLYGVYYGSDNYFDKLYTYFDEDLKTMLEALRPLDKSRDDPYPKIKELITEGSF